MRAILLFFFISSPVFAQNFKLKFVGVEEGLRNPYIYSISQDRSGFLWAATSEGVIKYDGTKVETFLSELEDNFITHTFLDSRNKLWLGHSQGRLTCYSEGKFRYILSTPSGGSITSITEDHSGNIWAVTKTEGLYRISTKFQVKHYKHLRDQVINTVLISGSSFYIGTDNGIQIYNLDSKSDLSNGKESNWLVGEKIQGLSPCEKGILIGTETSAYLLSFQDLAKRIPLQKLHEDINANVQHLFEDSKGNIWISTFDNGLFKLSDRHGAKPEIKNFNELNGLETNSVRHTYEDREGNIWIGTYGLGLACIVEEKFSYYSLFDKNLKNNMLSIAINGSEKFLGLENGMIHIDPKGTEKFYGIKDGLPGDKVTAIYLYKGQVLIGTDLSGLYIWNNRKKFQKLNISDNELCNNINAITSSFDDIWIATKGGLLQLDQKLKPIKHYGTFDGLPHNNVNHVYCDTRGTIWMGFPVGRIAKLDNGKIQTLDVSHEESILNISCITEDHRGQIWIGTNGSGVYRYDPQRSLAITASEGLKSNYCYLLSCDRQGNLWVGHRGGVSAINTNDLSIVTFDKRTGFDADCNFNSVAIDQLDNLWFGSTSGIIRFSPDNELRHRIPPVVSITSLKVSDREVNPASAIALPFKNYKIRIEYKAVSLKQPEEIVYMYKLEGQDTEWIETPLTNVFFSGLEPGKYKFLVKARKDNLESQPVAASFIIDQPLWKKPWVISCAVIFLSFGIYYIVKLREKKLKNFQRYLKTLLDEKTHEVTQQKEELAKKNKDITDSINYARKIQDAILPDQEVFKKAFPESFIFYQPRDIVSGDFYWFDQIGDKYVVVCADATGHGVPGALITMIGSTLIRDIYAKQIHNDPSDVMCMLHKEFKHVMKQQGRAEQLNDSMDISIAELDFKTGVLKVASSMRPIFLHKGNSIIHLKADRIINEQENIYKTKEFKLEKGDGIYLFTDGFTDQFGGPHGKKIKTSGLKDLLTKISAMTMDEQSKYIREHFESWKKNHEQVDDVLMIGVRI